MTIKTTLNNFFKKPTDTDLKLFERSIRSRARLRQQAFDYQEFVKRDMVRLHETNKTTTI
jgi:hypothetical protein